MIKISKNESIFLAQCFNVAKEDLIARNRPIETNITELFDLAEKIYIEGMRRDFPYLADKSIEQLNNVNNQ